MAQRPTEPAHTKPSAVVAEPRPSIHEKIYDVVPQCQSDGAQMLDGQDLARLVRERSNRPGASGFQAPSFEVAGTVTDDADEEGLMSLLMSPTEPSAAFAEPTPSIHEKIYDLVPQCMSDGAQMLDGQDLARLVRERSNRPGASGFQAPSLEAAGTVTDDADEEGLMSLLKSKGPPGAQAAGSFVARWGITMPDCDDTYVPSCYGEAFLDKLNPPDLSADLAPNKTVRSTLRSLSFE